MNEYIKMNTNVIFERFETENNFSMETKEKQPVFYGMGRV